MTSRLRSVSLILAGLAFAMAAGGFGARPATASGSTSSAPSSTLGQDQAAFDAVDEYARTQLKELPLPGLALAIVLDGSGGWGIAVLTNANYFNVNGERIQGLSTGILAILHGRSPPAVSMPHHPILLPLTGIVIGIAFLQALAVVRRGYRLLRGRGRPTRRRDVTVLTLCAGWVAFLLAAVPAILYPLGVLLVDVPDFGWSLILAATVAAAHALTLLGRSRRPTVDPAPSATSVEGSSHVPSTV